MSEPSPNPKAPNPKAPPHETLVDELCALATEAEAMARAEVAYQSARLSLGGKLVGRIAGWGALALALVFFALMALVVGLLLAIVPMLGVWGAMAVVVLGLLLATAASLLVARAGWRRLRRLFSSLDGTL